MPAFILINGGEIIRHEDGRCMVYFTYYRRTYRKYIAPGAIVVCQDPNTHGPLEFQSYSVGVVYDAVEYSDYSWIIKTWPIGKTTIGRGGGGVGNQCTHSFLWQHMMMLFEYPLEESFEDCEHEKQRDGDHTKNFMMVCNAVPSERPALIPIPGRRLPAITCQMIDDPSFTDPPELTAA